MFCLVFCFMFFSQGAFILRRNRCEVVPLMSDLSASAPSATFSAGEFSSIAAAGVFFPEPVLIKTSPSLPFSRAFSVTLRFFVGGTMPASFPSSPLTAFWSLDFLKARVDCCPGGFEPFGFPKNFLRSRSNQHISPALGVKRV